MLYKGLPAATTKVRVSVSMNRVGDRGQTVIVKNGGDLIHSEVGSCRPELLEGLVSRRKDSHVLGLVNSLNESRVLQGSAESHETGECRCSGSELWEGQDFVNFVDKATIPRDIL